MSVGYLLGVPLYSPSRYHPAQSSNVYEYVEHVHFVTIAPGTPRVHVCVVHATLENWVLAQYLCVAQRQDSLLPHDA